MKYTSKELVYLGIFISALAIILLGLIVLSPNVISLILGLGYLGFFLSTKFTKVFDRELFFNRYEKAFLSLVALIITIIQLTINDAHRVLPIIFMGFTFLLIAYLVFNWIYEKIKTIRELKNEKLQSELSLLRSQINPHFFFNTLNNLYGLAIQKSEETPDVIFKLSEMMRYTIYDGKKETVTIEQEVVFLENYIDLHTIRHFQKLSINFDSDIQQPELEIAPLLLINLLENAFKHGAETLEKDAFINMKISAENNLLNFVVENNFEDTESKENGIGLSNLRRRLSLLYPNRYNFDISTHNNIFRVELEIDLNS